MRLSIRVLCAGVMAFLLPACGGVESLGPTALDEGVVVYMNAGFRGVSQQIGADVSDLGRVEGPCGADENGLGSWNDCISSIRVLPGWTARIYGDRNFRGAVLEVAGEISDLSALRGDCSGSYDDCVSSIRVTRK